MNAPYTERYVRCGERTGANHPLLLDWDSFCVMSTGLCASGKFSGKNGSPVLAQVPMLDGPVWGSIRMS